MKTRTGKRVGMLTGNTNRSMLAEHVQQRAEVRAARLTSFNFQRNPFFDLDIKRKHHVKQS